MRRVTKIAAALLCGSLGVTALTACGSNSTSSSSAPSGSSTGAASSSTIKVGMAYDVGGRGDHSFNDSAAAGLDKAVKDFGVQFKELQAVNGESDADRAAKLDSLAANGYNPIVAIGFNYANAVKTESAKYPNVKFAIVDDASNTATNVTNLVFTEEQSSYLVGVAAALKSKTGTVGFIGGVDVPLIHKFQAGYQAGVKSVKPNDKVIVKYLSPAGDFSGFASPNKGKAAAQGMLSQGADVIYAAAGSSGDGSIQAVAAQKGAWAIGVDSDQHELPALAPYKNSILTSALKNVDVAVYDYIKSIHDGSPLTGTQTFSLAKGGVGYATSGGFVDDIKTQLDQAKADIVSGKVTVPTTTS
ncbi:BMP family lipoprotein [Streptacidiphilus rugosus]|uniref:BMP family lipoprotein n=1 Tax=Streptacidiphilus rugosus TaxID=405783 RepID=UPI00055D3F6B|nr:BMP family ABC transporter substrate-binding protein [Streptacidiphilus rugosus]